MPDEPRLNIIADPMLDNGLGEAARGLMIAADAAQLDWILTPVRCGSSQRDAQARTAQARAASRNINLLAINPQTLAALPLRTLLRAVGNRPTLAAWHWELLTVPPAWRAQSQWLNEVWAPSAYVGKAFAAGLHDRIALVPPSVTHNAASFQLDLPIENDAFVFLAAFNPRSCAQRKNPLGVVEAYACFRQQHDRSRKTRLVIKTQDLASHPAVHAALHDAAKQVGAVVLDARFTKEQRAALWQRANAFVSLHRAEGFGLAMAEAMAAGKPVVATGHSGNLDFTRNDNSWLVNFSLRAITAADHALQPEFAAQYGVGQLWAEPDADDAAARMAEVFAGGEAVRRRAEAGMKFMQTQYAPAVIGARMRERMEAVLATHAGAPYTRKQLLSSRRAMAQHPDPKRRVLQRLKAAGLSLLERMA